MLGKKAVLRSRLGVKEGGGLGRSSGMTRRPSVKRVKGEALGEREGAGLGWRVRNERGCTGPTQREREGNGREVGDEGGGLGWQCFWQTLGHSYGLIALT